MLFRKEKLDWRYGVSELLIVVAGVLIALTADGWLQRRNLRTAERASLSRLANDMQVDIDDISGNLARTRRGSEAAIWLMERRGEPFPTPDSLSRRLTDFTACSILSANTSEYTALKSSGQLTNLRDAAFRQRLVNLYEQYPYVSALYDSDCRLMEEGIAAIESLLDFGLDPSWETWPVSVTGQPSDVLQNATFQRTAGWVANLRLYRAGEEESLLAELDALQDRAIELAGR
jgi:hypothetical protein